MQLLPILLVAAVIAVGGGLRPVGVDWNLSHGAIAAIACGPNALILLLHWLGMKWCERQLVRRKRPRYILRAERFGRVARLFIVLNHMSAVLVFNWFGTVRALIGDQILLDEFIAILPAMLGLIGTWWASYPIERRIHNATLMRQLDEGRPVYPTLSRSDHVWLQVRLQLLLSLVPVLVIATVTEAIGTAGEAYAVSESAQWLVAGGKLVAGAGVFMLAPLMARVVLDVTPMPGGSTRDMLLEICTRHGVKIRELLIWNTNGSVFNAAVMGIIGKLRYVMLTDALLETMHENQVRAVMAHEIGHVRRHHMVWLVLCLLACFTVVDVVREFSMRSIEAIYPIQNQSVFDGVGVAVGIAQLLVSLILFAWVSRRFERQADTFAVQHLSAVDSNNLNVTLPDDHHELTASNQTFVHSHQTSSIVTPDAVHSMCDSLNAIAHLNAIDLHRRSWRHGSIAWRIEYLMSIIGRPLDQLPIDRQVRRVKVAAAIILLGAFGYAIFEQAFAAMRVAAAGGIAT